MSKLQVSWKKQNKQLDNDAENNVQLKKQINKQTGMDSLIQNSINEKISELKEEAAQLTKKLENQKYKNAELQTIIRIIKTRMSDEHKLEANSAIDSNFDSVESLERKIKKYEYDLSQISSKANKIRSIVDDKKHQISLLRTERVIDSGIFKSIERQLVITEMQFKKLLIEKIRQEKVYEECLNEYNSLKLKAQQYFQTQQTLQKTLLSQEGPQPLTLEGNSNSLNFDKNKFKEIQRNVQNKNIQSQFKKEQKNSYFQFKVKKILMNLNFSAYQEFIYNWINIETINGKYFQILNYTGDEINNLEEQIKKIQTIIEENSVKFYSQTVDLTKTQKYQIRCQKMKKQIEKASENANFQINALKHFIGTENFSELAKFVQIQNEAAVEMGLQTLADILKLIEQKMNTLNYCQAPKLNEQFSLIKTTRTQKQKKEPSLEDVINRVKVFEQSDKIMKKEDFKEEYRKMMEIGTAPSLRQTLKKKSKKYFV